MAKKKKTSFLRGKGGKSRAGSHAIRTEDSFCFAARRFSQRMKQNTEGFWSLCSNDITAWSVYRKLNN